MKLHGIQIDTHKSQSKNLMKNHLVFLENTWKSIYCWRMNGQKILRKNIWKSLYFGIEKDTWKSNCWSSPWIFLLIILLLISEPYQCLKDSCGQFFLSFYHFDEWVEPMQCLKDSQIVHDNFSWTIFCNLDVWVVPVSERFSVDIVADSRLNSPLSSILIDSSLMFIWGQNIWLQVNLIWPILFFETKDLIHYLNF